MRAYMNNLHGRRHEDIYGPGAFFDLDLEGRQADMLKDILPNTECIVASYGDSHHRLVVFHTYVLERVATCSSEKPGELCRVFFGRLRSDVRMRKGDAAQTAEYAPFFNINGDFKRPSAYFGPHNK
jgi:hypothetical protein